MVSYYGYVKWYRKHLSDVKLSKRLRAMERVNRKIGLSRISYNSGKVNIDKVDKIVSDDVCYGEKKGVCVYYNMYSKEVCFVVDVTIRKTIPYEHELENIALLDSIQMEENRRRMDEVSKMVDSSLHINSEAEGEEGGAENENENKDDDDDDDDM